MTARFSRFVLGLSAGIFAMSGAQAALVDLTAPGSSTSINGAFFQVSDPNTGAGSGAIQSFLRTQGSTSEAGFNTDGALTLDQVAGCCTQSITLDQLELVNVGGADYFALSLDINEPNGGARPRITLQTLELWVNTATGSDDNYLDGLGTKVWDLAGDVVELSGGLGSGGSGNFDYDVIFSTSLLAGFAPGDYLYLYNVFGRSGSSGSASEGGFEEWAARTVDASAVPAPATVWLLGTGVLGMFGWSRRKAAA